MANRDDGRGFFVERNPESSVTWYDAVETVLIA